MQSRISNRLALLLCVGFVWLAVPTRAPAQDDPNQTPLGDVARSLRKKPAASEVIIDNDNFSKVVDEAESRRANGSTMVFSLDPTGKGIKVSSPDVSCNLSFSSRATSLLADPVMLDELPRDELVKLDGPASIDGDSLQVSMHNGTNWELREVMIGLTILRNPSPSTASMHEQARLLPAASLSSSAALDPAQKQPDMTVLLRIKGSAAPSSTALFRTQLNFALFPDQEWHWAIVRAKGVPPQTPVDGTFAAQVAAAAVVPGSADAPSPSVPGATTPKDPADGTH